MVKHKLILKKCFLIFFLRNLHPLKGLLNRTRFIVKNLHKNFIKATIITESHKRINACILRIDLTLDKTLYLFRFKRKQLPVILGYAMTINKAQG